MGSCALITGITGQDGSFLAELLLSKGYEVHGLMRRSSSFNTGRLNGFFDQLYLHYGDMLDAGSLTRLVADVEPDEVYNLAAQSHVRVSFDQPVYSAEVAAIGALNLLEAVRGRPVRYYQASSSEMFGNQPGTHDEDTPFKPCSPYACAKVFAHHTTVNYREAYGIHASCGILFNHESERRGETFLTRKITRAAGRIACGLQDKLVLGNLDAKRDWGFAGDYVEAMWLMLQQDEPGDYVIATGRTTSVRSFLNIAFAHAELYSGQYVTEDAARYLRPAEVDCLCGDASKAKQMLDWEPLTDLADLIRRMVDHDMELARVEALTAVAV